MKKLGLPILFCLLFGNASFAQSSVVRDYISRFRDIAISEMQRTGVPASITLAQGILETEAGKSPLVKASNNHFGIKCKSDWKGEWVTHDDDAKGECFRKYPDPAQSYKDHSDFLKNRAHYAPLFKLDPTDYKSWAHGLKKAGYATNPKYPQLLIKLIQDYDLQQYTLMALQQNSPVQENQAGMAGIPGTETKEAPPSTEADAVFFLHTVQPKETAYAISKKYGVAIGLLLQWNNLPSTALKAGQQLRINKN